MNEIHIRHADERDADAAAELLAELGYHSTPASVRDRIRLMVAGPGVAVFVAEESGVVRGLAAYHEMNVLHEDSPRGQLTALVVSDAARRRGVGLALVRHVEELASTHGVASIVVATANHRTEAHRFYEKVGYEWTGRRYAKRLR